MQQSGSVYFKNSLQALGLLKEKEKKNVVKNLNPELSKKKRLCQIFEKKDFAKF